MKEKRKRKKIFVSRGRALFFFWSLKSFDFEAPAADRESLCALSAERILAFLEDRAPSSYRDLVLLNAAVRLYGGGKAVSMEVGLLQAKQAWESGAVRALFEAWQARCRL